MLPLVSTVPLGSTVSAAISLGARCDRKVCDITQYCSKFHNDCVSCEPVCDPNSHNFESETCLTDCKNYLYDRTYVNLSDYAAEIKTLKIYLTVLCVLVLLILILFFAVNGSRMFRCCMRAMAKLKAPVKKPVEPMTMANPHTASPKMRPKLQTQNNNLNRTSSIFTVTGTEYEAKTVSTPISTRHPAEDMLSSEATATTDYSYDNKALQLTPVNEEKPRIETTF